MKNLLKLLLLALIACNGSTKETSIEKQSDKADFFLASNPFPIDLIEGRINYMPPTHQAHGQQIIAYELNLFNTYDIDFAIRRVEVYQTLDREQPIASFDSSYLALHFDRPGNGEKTKRHILSGNATGIVNLLWSLPEQVNLPLDIYHKVVISMIADDDSMGREIPIELGLNQIKEHTTLTLGLPFRKGRWLYGAQSHQDSRNLAEGNASYPQRYAIDWILLDSSNAFSTADISKNENWFGYGQELLAVADGKVVGIKDSIIENIPWEGTAIKMNRETISGNYIRLDLGNGVYAHYAHLIPGSLKVKLGESVRQGQTLALLGNSGNSDCPHLHFHLESAHKLALGGEGLPYHFEAFEELTSYTMEEYNTSFTENRMIVPRPLSHIQRRNELPIGNGIIEFK
ncbi:MAG: M23 family metallopeptidase [Bacteroidia bacterium]